MEPSRRWEMIYYLIDKNEICAVECMESDRRHDDENIRSYK